MEDYKVLLLEFLQTPLNDGGQILQRFAAQPQRRYRTKFWPHHLRKAKMLAGRPFRVAKRLITYKSKG